MFECMFDCLTRVLVRGGVMVIFEYLLDCAAMRGFDKLCVVAYIVVCEGGRKGE